MTINRWLLAAALLLLPVGAAHSQLESPNTLPILPWLSIPETTLPAIRKPISDEENVIARDDVSPYSNGPSVSVADANPYKIGRLFGINGLRFATIHFDASRTARMVIFMVEKGEKGSNIEPYIDTLRSTYGEPMVVRGEEDTEDLMLIFDLDRYVVEAAMSPSGSFITVVFATSRMYKRFKAPQGEGAIADMLRR